MSPIPNHINALIDWKDEWENGETNTALWYAIIDRYGFPEKIRAIVSVVRHDTKYMRPTHLDRYAVVYVTTERSAEYMRYTLYGYLPQDFDVNLEFNSTNKVEDVPSALFL